MASWLVMAPVDKTSPDNMSGFKLISSCKSHDTFLIHKYKSISTGITVFIADIDGPLIHGNFCLGKFNIYNAKHNLGF